MTPAKNAISAARQSSLVDDGDDEDASLARLIGDAPRVVITLAQLRVDIQF